MPHGKICYLEIPANRAEDSAAFYSNIFGWKVWPRGDGNLTFEDSGSVNGTGVKAADRTPDERTRVYIMVDNIADALAQITASGGRILAPRTDIGSNMARSRLSSIQSGMISASTRSRRPDFVAA